MYIHTYVEISKFPIKDVIPPDMFLRTVKSFYLVKLTFFVIEGVLHAYSDDSGKSSSRCNMYCTATTPEYVVPSAYCLVFSELGPAASSGVALTQIDANRQCEN